MLFLHAAPDDKLKKTSIDQQSIGFEGIVHYFLALANQVGVLQSCNTNLAFKKKEKTFNMSHPNIRKKSKLIQQYHEVFKWFSLRNNTSTGWF